MQAHDLVAWAGAVTAVVGALLLIVRMLRPLARTLGDVREFLDEWRGRPSRPGHEREPGVPERLSAIEVELRADHGTTLRDVVLTVDRNLVEHIETAERLFARIDDDIARVEAAHREGEALWKAVEALQTHDPHDQPDTDTERHQP